MLFDEPLGLEFTILEYQVRVVSGIETVDGGTGSKFPHCRFCLRFSTQSCFYLLYKVIHIRFEKIVTQLYNLSDQEGANVVGYLWVHQMNKSSLTTHFACKVPVPKDPKATTSMFYRMCCVVMIFFFTLRRIRKLGNERRSGSNPAFLVLWSNYQPYQMSHRDSNSQQPLSIFLGTNDQPQHDAS